MTPREQSAVAASHHAVEMRVNRAMADHLNGRNELRPALGREIDRLQDANMRASEHITHLQAEHCQELCRLESANRAMQDKLSAVYGVLTGKLRDVDAAITIIELREPPELMCEDCSAPIERNGYCPHCGATTAIPTDSQRCPPREGEGAHIPRRYKEGAE